VKLDFGSLGKLSSSNYKSASSLAGFTNLNNTSDIFSKHNILTKNISNSLFNSMTKKEPKAFFNDSKGFEKGLFSKDTIGLQEKSGLKTSFLKGRESIGSGFDMSLISETSEKLRSLSSKELENMSNIQVKELLNLANLITKIAKNTKYYS